MYVRSCACERPKRHTLLPSVGPAIDDSAICGGGSCRPTLSVLGKPVAELDAYDVHPDVAEQRPGERCRHAVPELKYPRLRPHADVPSFLARK